MKVLFAGSSGWIGSAVFKRAIDTFETVQAYDIKEGRDLLDTPLLHHTLKGMDLVINLAGEVREARSIESPTKYWRNNLLAAVNLFTEATKLGVKVIHTSTPSAGPESYYQTPYGASKSCAELAAWQALEAGGNIVLVRLYNIYGPNQPEDFAVPMMLRRAAAGEALNVNRNVRDYVYLDDVVKIFCDVLPGLPSNDKVYVRYQGDTAPMLQLYEIGTGHGVSDAELAMTAIKTVGQVAISDRLRFSDLPSTMRVANPLPELRGTIQLEEGMKKVWQCLC